MQVRGTQEPDHAGLLGATDLEALLGDRSVLVFLPTDFHCLPTNLYEMRLTATLSRSFQEEGITDLFGQGEEFLFLGPPQNDGSPCASVHARNLA